MNGRHIPRDLQLLTKRYYWEVHLPHVAADEAATFKELPVALRGEIVARLAGDALRGSSMLGGLDREASCPIFSVALWLMYLRLLLLGGFPSPF